MGADCDDYVLAVEDDWLCEPVLWTSWFHMGSARASSIVDLVSIEAQSFVEIIQTDMPMMHLACKYATNFVGYLNRTPRRDLSDVSKHDEKLAMVLDCLEESALPRKP